MSDRANLHQGPWQKPAAVEPVIFRPPVCVSSFEGQPDPPPLDWLVPGLLLKNEVTLFAGQTKLGKTYLWQQLMTSAAVSQQWLGQDVTQFRTLGFFAEDRTDILRTRQLQINRHHEITHDALAEEAFWWSREMGDPCLFRFEKFSSIPIETARWKYLAAFCVDAGIRFVPLDTAARIFQGGSENDRSQVSAIVDKLAWLADKIGGAVALDTHPNRSGGYYSGSSAWESTVRVTASLERSPKYVRETGEDADVRILYGMGSNYDASNAPIKMRWQDGVFVAEDMPQRKSSLSAPEKHDLDYRLLMGLRRLCQRGEVVPAATSHTKSMPRRAVRGTPEFAEWPLNWFDDSIQRLLDAGMATMIDMGGVVAIRPADMKLPGEKPWEPM